MKFRPCIDIHNGKVKQLVGGSLKDKGNQADENFVSEKMQPIMLISTKRWDKRRSYYNFKCRRF